jgi:hypothetical protein
MLQEDLQHPSESMKVKNKLEKLPFYNGLHSETSEFLIFEKSKYVNIFICKKNLNLFLVSRFVCYKSIFLNSLESLVCNCGV